MLQHSATTTFPDPGYHPHLSTLINMASYSPPDLSSLVHPNAGHQVNGGHPMGHHPSGEIFIPSAAQSHLPVHHRPPGHTGQPQRHHSASSTPSLGINGVYAAGPAQNACCLTGGAALPVNIKDSRWLTLEVCRQFQRNQCSRTENECKFAHPPTHVDVQNGRVICCYDSIKGKCQRRDPPCKYLHPPQHLREQLMVNGRNSMILRNMQLQLLHQQYLAQRGAAAVAAAVGLSAGSSNPAPHNSLIYPGTMSLSLTNSSTAPGYPVLNFGYSPYVNALANASAGLPTSITGHDHLMPTAQLTNEHVTTSAATLNGFSSVGSVCRAETRKPLLVIKLSTDKQVKPSEDRRLPIYSSQSSHPATPTAVNKLNGSTLYTTATSTVVTSDSLTSAKGGGVAMLHGDSDTSASLDAGGNRVYVTNGAVVDTNTNNINKPSVILAGSSVPATDLANMYHASLDPPSAILSLHPGSSAGQQHAMVSLAAMAAAVNGGVHPSSQMAGQYQTEPAPALNHAAYFQQGYHMEISPFAYQ